MIKNRQVLLGGGIAVLLLLFAIFHQDIASYIASKSIQPLAIYKGMEVYGYASEFDEILISNPVSNAQLYVELPDKRRFRISEFPEDVASKVFEEHFLTPGNTINYNTVRSFLSYRDGKLIFVSLEASSCPFLISPHKDGPYIKLPIKRDRFLEIFGEPIRWQKAPNPPSGP